MISQDNQVELEPVMEKAGNAADSVRSVWSNDLNSQKEFYDDQRRKATGRKMNRWSMITRRTALAVFTRSPAVYEALKSIRILQLPSIRSLKHFTCANQDKPVWCEEHMHFQLSKYENLKYVMV